MLRNLDDFSEKSRRFFLKKSPSTSLKSQQEITSFPQPGSFTSIAANSLTTAPTSSTVPFFPDPQPHHFISHFAARSTSLETSKSFVQIMRFIRNASHVYESMFCVAKRGKNSRRVHKLRYFLSSSSLSSLCAFVEEIHGKLFVYNYNSLIARSLPLWNCEKRF
jgi:hypothetical protein